jgi:hypothetical protein
MKTVVDAGALTLATGLFFSSVTLFQRCTKVETTAFTPIECVSSGMIAAVACAIVYFVAKGQSEDRQHQLDDPDVTV